MALRVDRLDLLRSSVEVVESMAEVRGRLVIGPTKTGRRRIVPLPRFLAQLLGEHVGAHLSAEGYVFTAAEGGPVRHRNFYARHFKPAVRRTGLPPDIRFHDLRHTCAAWLIDRGHHMQEVKEHLGHSSIRVTSDRYGHAVPGRPGGPGRLPGRPVRSGPRVTPVSRGGPNAAPDSSRGPLRGL